MSVSLDHIGEHGHLLIGRRTADGPSQHEPGPRRLSVSGFGEGLHGQAPGGFDEFRIVQQHQSLKRRARAGPLGGAFLPARCVKHHQRRMEVLPLPVHIEPAAIEVVVGVGVVGASGKVEVVPVALRLVGPHAPTTHPTHEQSTGGQGRVADHFGIDAVPVLAGKQAVLRIPVGGLLGYDARSAVGNARHDLSQDVADVPALGLEFRGQPVE